MAQIEKRKNGSYRIRVFCGYSADGEKQKSQSMTWKPPRAGMNEKQIEKALQKAAFEFEEKCRSGQTVNAEKFENFCETWFTNYAQRTLKQSGIDRCRQYCPRVYEQLGHLRLDRITPYEIDNFILWLTKEKVRNDPEYKIKVDLKGILKKQEITQVHFAERAGVSAQTIKQTWDGKNIMQSSAEKIAAALDEPIAKVFEKQNTERSLTPKTIKNYVSFISSVFDYAVKIKAIKENPCKNAVIPKYRRKNTRCLHLNRLNSSLISLNSLTLP